MHKPNNPRFFADTVSIDVWRNQYADGTALADLHIDVVFGTGRFGGDELKDSPVRFRMSLKRAEIRVKTDCGGVIKIPPQHVKREEISHGKQDISEETKLDAKAHGKAKVSTVKASGELGGEATAQTQVTKKYVESNDVSPMKVQHKRTGNGYAFTIEPNRSAFLDGQPWQSDEPRMKLKDTKAARKKGEPPEILVEIHCKREDLLIEDIQFKDEKYPLFPTLPGKKKLAVEQALKAEVERIGLLCGDLSEPFSTIVLGDASPYVE